LSALSWCSLSALYLALSFLFRFSLASLSVDYSLPPYALSIFLSRRCVSSEMFLLSSRFSTFSLCFLSVLSVHSAPSRSMFPVCTPSVLSQHSLCSLSRLSLFSLCFLSLLSLSRFSLSSLSLFILSVHSLCALSLWSLSRFSRSVQPVLRAYSCSPSLFSFCPVYVLFLFSLGFLSVPTQVFLCCLSAFSLISLDYHGSVRSLGSLCHLCSLCSPYSIRCFCLLLFCSICSGSELSLFALCYVAFLPLFSLCAVSVRSLLYICSVSVFSLLFLSFRSVIAQLSLRARSVLPCCLSVLSLSGSVLFQFHLRSLSMLSMDFLCSPSAVHLISLSFFSILFSRPCSGLTVLFSLLSFLC